MITIRYFEEKDTKSILALGKNFELTPYMVDPEFRKLTQKKIPLLVKTQLTNNNIQILVACIDQKVVGFISFIYEQEFSKVVSKKCASILFLSTDIQYRQRGIATKLLEYCFSELKKISVSIVRVGTDSNNFALSLYLKNGFERVLDWSIYRIYKKEKKASEAHFQYLKNDFKLQQFPIDSLLSRPFVWFYDPDISSKDAFCYLTKKVLTKIQQQKTQWIHRTIENSVVSLTISRDIMREQYYSIHGSLWTINDLYEQPESKGYLPAFLKTTLNSLPNFEMAEYWVCDSNKKIQQTLLIAGFHKVYGGIALRKIL